MKAISMVVAVLVGVSSLAEAKVYNCIGKDVTKGKVILSLNGEKAVVKGSFQVTGEGSDSEVLKINAKGTMYNQRRSGNKTHDYFDLTGDTAGVSYIRTGKGLESKAGGWISLVTPGPSDHDMPGYTYAAFFCREK